MGTSELVLDIIARDKASQEFAKVGKSADDTGMSFDKLGKMAIAALSVGAIVSYGIESVKAFADAERAQSDLQLAFQKFPALADTSFESLVKLNDEMEDKAAIDADSLTAADAVLARFKLTGQEIEKVTPLLVDYATVSGKDAPAAAETLGKALMGNARALKELGIEFTPTGDKTRDLATLMGLLQEKVGGAGEAFRETAAGKLQAFQIASDNIKESVGEALVPALTAATDAMEFLADAAPDIVSAFTQMQDLTNGLAGVLRNMPALPDWMSGGGLDLNWMAMFAPGGMALEGFNAARRAMDDVGVGADALGFKLDEQSGKWEATAETTRILSGAVDKVGTAMSGAMDSIQLMSGAATDNQGKLTELKLSADNLDESLAILKAQFDEQTGKNRDMISAESDLEASMDDLAKMAADTLRPALDTAKGGFDLTEDSGRKAADAFNDVAAKAEDAAIAAADQGRWEDARRYITGARDDLVDQAIQWGMTEKEAKAYVDRILTVPRRVDTMIQVNSNIESVRSIWNAFSDRWVTLHVALDQAFAGGGTVRGAGGPKDDKVAVSASPGEYVLQESSARAIGYDTLDWVNRTGKLPMVPIPVAAGTAAQPTTVVAELHVDGRRLVETLLRYRREHGGAPLGLDT